VYLINFETAASMRKGLNTLAKHHSLK